MKDIFKAFERYVVNNIKRPNGGYITQEEHQKAKKRNRKKKNKQYEKQRPRLQHVPCYHCYMDNDRWTCTMRKRK